jgi:hypothetical protein
MKVDRKIYKGIEFVVLTELPVVQREHLLKTLSPDQFIKILIDGAVVSNCLQYKDYSNWFDNVFRTRPQVVKEVEVVTETVAVSSASLALK